MAKVAWTPAARTDLADLAYYIAFADNRPLTADRVVDDIIAKCDLMISLPSAIYTPSNHCRESQHPHLGEDYRRFVFKRWVIIYRPITSGIEVLRIFDSARDYRHCFRGTVGARLSLGLRTLPQHDSVTSGKLSGCISARTRLELIVPSSRSRTL